MLFLAGLFAINFELFFIGFPKFLTSQIHIVPSFENEITLFAICVPVTFNELTGYLWPSADTSDLCTGVALTLKSHINNCPLLHPPII